MSTTINVNDAFDADKVNQQVQAEQRVTDINAQNRQRLERFRQQVANGTMSERTNGDTVTFTVLTGIDRGETWTVNTKNLEFIQVQANTGLDTMADGRTALYLMADQPAWHGLGQLVPEGLHTGTDVLTAAGLLWTVEKMPNRQLMPDGVVRDVPGSWITYRSDTFEPFGPVGGVYYPFQNITAYGILDELLSYGMIAKSAGSFRGGQSVFVSAEVPTDLVVDPGGIEDKPTLYVNLVNTHNGKGSLVANVSEWYIRCQNTHRLQLANPTKANEHAISGTYKIRHTRGGLNKIAEAQKVLGLTRDFHELFIAEETALARTPFSANELDALITGVFGTPDPDKKRDVTMDAKRREAIHMVWEVELGRLGATGFAAENAITGYLDHGVTLKPRNELKGNPLAALGQALLEDTFMERKTNTHALLMQRVR